MKSFCFPGNIEEEIINMNTDFYYPRTKKCSELMKYIEQQILALLKSNGKLVVFSSSGTGAMDISISSFLKPYDFPLILNGGTFGKRWKSLCDFYKIPNMEMILEFGEQIDIDKLDETLKKYKNKYFLLQHCETSSGVLYDLKNIVKICKKHDCKIILDAISSFLCDDLNLEDDNIDICILSSQKGLNIFPGLSMIIMNQDMYNMKKNSKSFYFDIDLHLSNIERGQLPFSPPVQLLSQLYNRIQDIDNIGKEEYIENIKNNADYFRAQINKLQVKMFSSEKSNCETAVFFQYDVERLVSFLNSKNIFIMPSNLKNMIRVSHTGCLDYNDYDELIKEIVSWEKMEK